MSTSNGHGTMNGKAEAVEPPQEFWARAQVDGDGASRRLPLRYFKGDEFHIVEVTAESVGNGAQRVAVQTRCERRVTYTQRTVQMPERWALKVGTPCTECYAGVPSATEPRMPKTVKVQVAVCEDCEWEGDPASAAMDAWDDARTHERQTRPPESTAKYRVGHRARVRTTTEV